MTCIKLSVANLPVYSVPQDRSVIKLNQNESPFDIPPLLKTRILEQLNGQLWNRYPDTGSAALLSELADYTGHDPDGIVLGNGSNEIIQAVFSASCSANDQAVMVTPGFAVYPRVAAVLGVNAIKVPLLPSFDFDESTLLKAVKDVQLVIIASPNVPTGIAMKRETIEQIAAQTSGMFAVDEAYFEFNDCTALDLLKTYESMVIIRTLSKACSLAGARLGYALASPAVAQGIEKAKLPFSVGIFQQVAGKILLHDRTFIRKATEQVIAEREKLLEALKKIPGITPIPSQANFILMKIGQKKAQEVFQELYENGVLVRHFNTPALHDTLRVTVGTKSENACFIQALQAIMEHT